jgi:hypothetical protein
MDCDPHYERMAANSARVSGPMHRPCTAKLRSSVLYGQVKKKKKLGARFLVLLVPTSHLTLHRQTSDKYILVTELAPEGRGCAKSPANAR